MNQKKKVQKTIILPLDNSHIPFFGKKTNQKKTNPTICKQELQNVCFLPEVISKLLHHSCEEKPTLISFSLKLSVAEWWLSYVMRGRRASCEL